MAIQDVLAAELDQADTDESGTASTASANEQADGPISPFSMEYDVDGYNIEPENLNNVLTGLVAVTNLL
jgi:hypothetical protein